MSAFLVSLDVYRAIRRTLAALEYRADGHAWETSGWLYSQGYTAPERNDRWDALVRDLARHNDLAVCARYGDKPDVEIEDFCRTHVMHAPSGTMTRVDIDTSKSPLLSPEALVKALQCVRYQTAESYSHADKDKVEQVTNGLIARLCEAIVSQSQAYKDAPWGDLPQSPTTVMPYPDNR